MIIEVRNLTGLDYPAYFDPMELPSIQAHQRLSSAWLPMVGLGAEDAPLAGYRAARREDRHRRPGHRLEPHDGPALGRAGCSTATVQADAKWRATVVDAGRARPAG